MFEFCLNCNGKMMIRDDELFCLQCGKIKYIRTIVFRNFPKNKLQNEWVKGVSDVLFQIQYQVIKDREKKITPIRGTYSDQPYASCVNVSGPMRELHFRSARNQVEKNFFTLTGLKLKDLENVID